MKNLKLYIIELILFICIIIFNIFYKNNILLYAIICSLTLITYLLFGFYKDNSYVKNNVIRIVVSCLLSYFLVTYAMGLFVGFNKTIFSFTPSYIFKIIILEFIVIVCEEILRYIIAKKSYKNNLPLIIFTIIMSILNIIIEINGYNFDDREIIFVFVSVVVIPVISREFLCSYLTNKVSLIPSIIFKSVIILYQFILPIIPSLGNYLYSVSNLILVYAIFFFSNRIISYSEKSDKYSRKMSTRVLYIPILLMLIVIVVLVSGILKYKMIAIGSNSMVPAYERGDAVIYEKITADNVKIGDIIAFKKNDIIITHRVVEIRNNTKHIFITKGDANNSVDAFEVEGYEVLGKVEYRIRYIGYPTLWINDFFRRGEINYDN